jgi:hypothetical protein
MRVRVSEELRLSGLTFCKLQGEVRMLLPPFWLSNLAGRYSLT